MSEGRLDEIKTKIRGYLRDEYLGEDGIKELEDSSPLISSGIIDSIVTLQLIDFLENEFGIEFSPHEVDQDNLDSVELIGNFVQQKLS